MVNKNYPCTAFESFSTGYIRSNVSMTEIKMFYLTGRTGKKYRFYTFPGPNSLKPEGGLYAITRRSQKKKVWEHEVVKIDETSNMSELKAMMESEGYDCHPGANCFAARLENDSLKRKRAAEDLWSNYFPSILSA
jgi:hypothetical protein